MSDRPTYPGTGTGTPSGLRMDESRDASTNKGEDLRETAREAQATASETARNLKEQAVEAAGAVRAEGEEVLQAARGKAEEVIEQQKIAGAEQGHNLAEAVRRIADDLEDTSPEIARHVRSAAESVDNVASALRERSVGDLVGQMNQFAQRQPVAFFGAAMVAGFALTRFARSSAAAPRMGSQHGGYTGGHATGDTGGSLQNMSGARNNAMAPGWVPEGGGSGAGASMRPATMPAATLGGAAAHRQGDAMPGSMPVNEGGTRGPAAGTTAPDPTPRPGMPSTTGGSGASAQTPRQTQPGNMPGGEGGPL